jgi:hypothetical protein
VPVTIERLLRMDVRALRALSIGVGGGSDFAGADGLPKSRANQRASMPRIEVRRSTASRTPFDHEGPLLFAKGIRRS